MPARSHWLIGRRTLRSAIPCASIRSSQSWFTVWYEFCMTDVSLMARAPIHDVRELSRPLKHEDDMAKKAKKAKKTAAATKKVAKKTTARKKK
jgi:hypothetical protein